MPDTFVMAGGGLQKRVAAVRKQLLSVAFEFRRDDINGVRHRHVGTVTRMAR